MYSSIVRLKLVLVLDAISFENEITVYFAEMQLNDWTPTINVP